MSHFLKGPSNISYKRLDLRRDIKTRLCDNQYGYPHENIIIMEDVTLRGYVLHPLSIAESGFYDINFVNT